MGINSPTKKECSMIMIHGKKTSNLTFNATLKGDFDYLSKIDVIKIDKLNQPILRYKKKYYTPRELVLKNRIEISENDSILTVALLEVEIAISEFITLASSNVNEIVEVEYSITESGCFE
jgi:hypothetical protein